MAMGLTDGFVTVADLTSKFCPTCATPLLVRAPGAGPDRQLSINVCFLSMNKGGLCKAVWLTREPRIPDPRRARRRPLEGGNHPVGHHSCSIPVHASQADISPHSASTAAGGGLRTSRRSTPARSRPPRWRTARCTTAAATAAPSPSPSRASPSTRSTLKP